MHGIMVYSNLSATGVLSRFCHSEYDIFATLLEIFSNIKFRAFLNGIMMDSTLSAKGLLSRLLSMNLTCIPVSLT